MSKTILLNQNWIFSKEGHDEPVTLPHTWNAIDGQDGGNDYYRGTCCYTTVLPDIVLPENGRAVLQFDAVAMTAEVYLNEQKLAEHKGGYSAFCVDITDALRNGSNLLRVNVDNSDNDTVYPQKADFTFYGGIYRDVTLHVVPAAHFALAENGAVPVRVTPIVTDLDARRCEVTLEAAVVLSLIHIYELEPTDTFPLKLYAEIVSNVILYRDTHIEIKLRNGQIL